MVAPAPHLNGHYVVFGELIEGHDVMMRINKLANKANDQQPLGNATIVDAGQLA